ncbi:uncharacterized protein LOC105688556 [Athalia rosae]|uniref:uncharacterized protein LOC105688556 n=1 Tax=Athalia rosae TaxID=37344 RepID=UPI0020335531|nr:uncharacterized protein LOC105688556 [Athalia rosae]
MCRSLREIITIRWFTSISKRIKKISFKAPDNGLRTLICVMTLLVIATSRNTQGTEVIPRVRSWRRRYNESPESLYLSYGGNPWGTSSPTIYENHHKHFLKKENINTRSNDSEEIEAAPFRGASNSSLRRSKRGVVHLYNMVVCATGCNPLAYKGYGCYCGFLGSGYTIDGIDRCCKMHDWCYEASDCPMFMEYFVPYYWKCYRGYKPICAVQHGDWGGSGSCAQRLCECDRALAECLRRYPCPTTKAVCTSSPWRLVQNLFMLL